MPKRDPGLRNFAKRTRPEKLRNWAAGKPRAAARRVNILLELDDRGGKDTLTRLYKLGFKKHAEAGRVLSGDLPENTRDAIEGVDGVKRVELSRPLAHELDAALVEARADAVHSGHPARRGAGVIIGIIDGGIDYRHESFLKNGKSRILRLWDQGLTPGTGEHHPRDVAFNFGVEYTQADISAVIGTTNSLNHTEQAPFHGTHVAGVAAGNGQPIAASNGKLRFVGVAPDADLIVVATTRGKDKNPGSIGDSADTFDAIYYILEHARRLKRPVAINLSLGDNMGPHDGTSLLEVGIANLMNVPGRVLIKSAGNEGNQSRHAEGVLTHGIPQDVTIEVQKSFVTEHPGKGEETGVTELAVEFWYPGANRMMLRITPPGGAPLYVPAAPFEGILKLSNRNEVAINADLDDPGNHDNRTHIELLPGDQTEVKPGIWTLRLEGTGPWDAWIQRDMPAKFDAPFVSAAKTVSTPGTTSAAITVGSYVNDTPYARSRPGNLSGFSGRGPTRDNRQAPTLVAPGEELTTPQPAPAIFGPFRGTSLSAPLVTGAAALMLEVNPRLTGAQIKRILELSASADPQTTAPDNNWGFGKLDVERACRHAAKIL